MNSKWDHNLRDFVKELIALRKAHPALRGAGSYKKLYTADSVYVFKRETESETIFVALNAAEVAHKVNLNKADSSQGQKRILFGQANFEVEKEIIRLDHSAVQRRRFRVKQYRIAREVLRRC